MREGDDKGSVAIIENSINEERDHNTSTNSGRQFSQRRQTGQMQNQFNEIFAFIDRQEYEASIDFESPPQMQVKL